MEYLFFVCYFVLSFSLSNVIAKNGGKRDMLVVRLILMHINNKASVIYIYKCEKVCVVCASQVMSFSIKHM